MVYTLDDRAEDAIPLVQELRTLAADDPLEDASTVAQAWVWLAALHARVGDVDRATDALARAEEIVARHGGPDSALRAARAEVALARSDFGTAHDEAIAALADPELHAGTPLARGDLGDRYTHLARALTQVGRREEAAIVAALADEAHAGADALRRR